MKQVTREQLIHCLINEDLYMRHDMDVDEDDTPEAFQEYINTLTWEQLLNEAAVDDEYFTLEEYIECFDY